MVASENSANNFQRQFRPRVRFDRGPQGLNLSHVKYDLLKISEIHDGVLNEELAMLPVGLFTSYLEDLKKDSHIHEFRIEAPELRVREGTEDDKSFTYTIHIQNSPQRSFKTLKIHVALYRSNWPNLLRQRREAEQEQLEQAMHGEAL